VPHRALTSVAEVLDADGEARRAASDLVSAAL